MAAKPLSEANFKLASFATNRWAVTVPAGLMLDAVLVPEFWAHNVRRLHQGDIVEVRCEDASFFAELYTIKTDKLAAYMAVLRHFDLNALQAKPEAVASNEPVSVEFRGRGKWSVMRGRDVLKSGFDTKADAEAEAARLIPVAA
jgi:hypothetical protein